MGSAVVVVVGAPPGGPAQLAGLDRLGPGGVWQPFVVHSVTLGGMLVRLGTMHQPRVARPAGGPPPPGRQQ
eukprot:gene10552-53339_t